MTALTVSKFSPVQKIGLLRNLVMFHPNISTKNVNLEEVILVSDEYHFATTEGQNLLLMLPTRVISERFKTAMTNVPEE